MMCVTTDSDFGHSCGNSVSRIRRFRRLSSLSCRGSLRSLSVRASCGRFSFVRRLSRFLLVSRLLTDQANLWKDDVEAVEGD